MTDTPKKRATRKRKSTTTVRKAKKTERTATPNEGAAGKPETAEFTGPARVYAFTDSVVETAKPDGDAPQVDRQWETWVMFQLAGESFALPVTAVQETLRVPTITRVPHAPYPVRGIINMRGQVVPVVSLRLRIGLPAAEIGPASRVLIVSSHGRVLGFLVDSVQQVVRLDMKAAEPPPPDVMSEQSEYIVGVYHLDTTLVILLDVDRVLLIPDSLQAAASGATSHQGD